MNERFKELRGEAFRLTEWKDLDYDAILEKFGELIVRECVQLSVNEEERFNNMGEDRLALAMENFQALLKQHFGVRE